jgi:phospholipid-binding lipoprotein MlaA
MSIATVIIALELVGAQATTEHQTVPAPATPVEKMDDRPAADLQPGRAADPPSAIEPTGPGKPTEAGESGDTIVVTARPGTPGDPLQGLNVKSYAVVQSIDKAVTGPVALTYKKAVPSPIRSGLRNFLNNLQEPVVFLNYLLQLKPGRSAETLGRFAINSTIGGAGLFDVAKRRPFELPYRTNGFAYTLGYYGVKPGPYMYLPLIGPTTVRDLGGRLVDLSVLPVAVGKPFSELAFVIPTTVVRLVDERAQAEDGMRDLRDGSSDPYATVRADYLRTRQAEIDALRGKHLDEDRPSSETATPGDSASAPPRMR